MHCECLTKFGAPLTHAERADPVPTGTEIVLRVTASGVCHTDLHYRSGGYDLGRGERLDLEKRGTKLPLVLGHEMAGRIVAAGPDAPALDPSRNYVVYPWHGCGHCSQCLADHEFFCPTPSFMGVHVDGGFATHIKVPHPKYLFDMGTLDPTVAAPLACSGLTAYAGLMKVRETLATLSPVIIGAGGLGMMATGIVKALGGPGAVVVDIDAGKRDSVLAAGGTTLISAGADDALEQIKAALGGPAQAVIDFVGSPITAQLGFDVLGRGGTLVLIGLFGGAAPWSLPLITTKTVTIQGSYVGTKAEFAELIALVSSGQVPIVPPRLYPLEDANRAIDDLETKSVIGRGVLIPA